MAIPFERDIPRFPESLHPISGEIVPAEPRAEGMPTARTTVLFTQRVAVGEEGVRKIGYLSSSQDVRSEVDNSYLNWDGINRETMLVNQKITDIQKHKTLFGGNFVDNASDARKLNDLDHRRSQTYDLLESLKIPLDQETQAQYRVRFLLKLGAQALYHNMVSATIDLERKQEISYDSEPMRFADWTQTGALSINLGGMTLIDFLKDTKSSKVSKVTAFRFLVESGLILEDEKFDDVLEQTDGDFFHQYPNTARFQIALAASFGTALIGLPARAIDAMVKNKEKNRSLDEAKVLAKKYVERTSEVQKSCADTLINPLSEDFHGLRQEIQGYMAEGKIAEFRALDVLGVVDTDVAKRLYRSARALATIYHQHIAFFTDLADSIRDFQIEFPNRKGMLTTDDIPTLVDEEIDTKDARTGDEVIKKAVENVHPSAYSQQFSVDPEHIQWGSLVKPSRVEVVFDKSRYKSFTVHMIYRNEEGESSHIEGSFQVQKGGQRFELNFLEAASEIPQIYEATRLATVAILADISSQTEKKRIKNTVEPVQKQQAPVSGGKIDHDAQEPLLPQAKTKVKTRPDIPAETSDNAIVENNTETSEQSQLIIDEAHQEKFQKQLERISHEDREHIHEAITRFNAGESVRFYPLKRRGPHDEVLYSLRTKATVRGGCRVLVTPIKGTSHFLVLSAGYRKDIYRDWGVE